MVASVRRFSVAVAGEIRVDGHFARRDVKILDSRSDGNGPRVANWPISLPGGGRVVAR